MSYLNSNQQNTNTYMYLGKWLQLSCFYYSYVIPIQHAYIQTKMPHLHHTSHHQASIQLVHHLQTINLSALLHLSINEGILIFTVIRWLITDSAQNARWKLHNIYTKGEVTKLPGAVFKLYNNHLIAINTKTVYTGMQRQLILVTCNSILCVHVCYTPSYGSPSCLQTTAASCSPQASSHTDLHSNALHTSTIPVVVLPFTRRTPQLSEYKIMHWECQTSNNKVHVASVFRDTLWQSICHFILTLYVTRVIIFVL